MENRILKYKTGDSIFEEGETSKSMFLIRKGMVRIFKKKAESTIEIDTMRTGQVLGEMGFLDGQPRSASAEALTEVELVEVAAGALEQANSNIPEWLKVLLKSIVNRLRNATNKIKQLEQASTAYEVDQYGNRSKTFVFVNRAELMKFSASLLLVASRFSKKDSEDNPIFNTDTLYRVANQMLHIGESKVSGLIDIFSKVGLVSIQEEKITAKDLNILDKFIFFLNEQNLLEAEKQRVLSKRGLVVLTFIIKYMSKFQISADGLIEVNFAQILANEKASSSKEPFRLAEAEELTKQGFISELKVEATDRVISTAKKETLLNDFRFFYILGELETLNESKRKAG